MSTNIPSQKTVVLEVSTKLATIIGLAYQKVQESLTQGTNQLRALGVNLRLKNLQLLTRDLIDQVCQVLVMCTLNDVRPIN